MESSLLLKDRLKIIIIIMLNVLPNIAQQLYNFAVIKVQTFLKTNNTFNQTESDHQFEMKQKTNEERKDESQTVITNDNSVSSDSSCASEG